MRRILRRLFVITLLAVSLIAAPVSAPRPADTATAVAGYIYNSPASGGPILAKYPGGQWTRVDPGRSVTGVTVFRTLVGTRMKADYVIIGSPGRTYTCHPDVYCLVGDRSLQINKVYR